MIYKYILSISGDGFCPERIFENIHGDFVVNSYFNPTDKKPVNASEEYGYGSLSFWHSKKFSTENEILEYENDFIEFIKKNNSLFAENGVTDLEIFMEIYFDGCQCNFEIFNKELLKVIGEVNVSLPISVYALEEEEIKKWEDEIKIIWASR